MKLKKFFTILGLTLFLCAMLLFLLAQGRNVDQLALALLTGFGCVLGLSGGAFVVGELLGKVENLETRVFYLEEELKKQKREKEE